MPKNQLQLLLLRLNPWAGPTGLLQSSRGKNSVPTQEQEAPEHHLVGIKLPWED